MTQLMLFDAPVPSTIPTASVATRTAAATRNIKIAQPEDGPQRIGNLAHLVLARYDMVARRREAQRRAAIARQQHAETA